MRESQVRQTGRDRRHQLAGALGISADAPILLAGSTHPGEERLIAEVFGRLTNAFPGLLFVVVPRHVERTGEVAAELATLGLRVRLRTQLDGEHEKPADALLVNTTGELRDWYTVATLEVIGKSLCASGAQNPIRW